MTALYRYAVLTVVENNRVLFRHEKANPQFCAELLDHTFSRVADFLSRYSNATFDREDVPDDLVLRDMLDGCVNSRLNPFNFNHDAAPIFPHQQMLFNLVSENSRIFVESATEFKKECFAALVHVHFKHVVFSLRFTGLGGTDFEYEGDDARNIMPIAAKLWTTHDWEAIARVRKTEWMTVDAFLSQV